MGMYGKRHHAGSLPLIPGSTRLILSNLHGLCVSGYATNSRARWPCRETEYAWHEWEQPVQKCVFCIHSHAAWNFVMPLDEEYHV